MIRLSRTLPAILCALTCWPTAAAAADLGSGLSLSGGASVVSDYRFRGISFSEGDPAIQGTLTLTHASGFYAGTWASSIADTELYGDVEVDLYAGWAGEIAPGMQVDLSAAYYIYPYGHNSAGDSDYAEATAKVSRALGPVNGTAGASYAWGQSALGGRDNLYVFSDLAAPLPGTPLTLKAHGGRSKGSLSPSPYFDWSFGLEGALGPVTIGATYVDTDLPEAVADPAIVFSIGAAF